jgi:catechol 2,3-dioxygenase-like lactoylglutathione lyase family enzyme
MTQDSAMAFHHVAIATCDLPATHAFYADAMGFALDRVNVAPTPEGGWARHAFYDTGNGEMIAFWDIHDDPKVGDFVPSISKGLGLPEWTNHIAFGADTLDDLASARDRWLAHGHDVAEIDHGWCTSIYTMDPNGIMVEWCCTTALTTAADRAHAAELLVAEAPPMEGVPDITFYEAAAVTTA